MSVPSDSDSDEAGTSVDTGDHEELGPAVEDIEEAVGLIGSLGEERIAKRETEDLAELVRALKCLEDAVEDARKEIVEEELDTRVDVGESIAGLTRVEDSRKYIESDDRTALDRLRQAGGDIDAVVSVRASAFAEEADRVGLDVEDFVGEYTVGYYRR